jgi:hypothetical protein
MAFNLEKLEEALDQAGWWTWYLVLRHDATLGRTVAARRQQLTHPAR